ncbi:GPW/gp25 family protein [Photorhabdus sp. RM96S]|uniref:GPW/gp25 family protein n=1 Tax=Photorhabdus sp. RM96S TaxID=3342822 RepID=UPI0036D984D2
MHQNFAPGTGFSSISYPEFGLASIQTRIEERVLRYEPRAEMTEIKVSQKTDLSNTLQVQVNYALRGSEISQQIEGILEMGEGLIEVIL